MLACVCLLGPAATLGRAADSLAYHHRSAAGLALHVVEVDLSDPRVRVAPALSAGGAGRDEALSGFVARLAPAAAINGTFFDTRTRRPIGDIVIGGELHHFGGMGTAIAFAPDGVDVIRLPKSRTVDWSEHTAVLAAGPLLVWGGFPKPWPGGEGFGDPSLFRGTARRSAVGVTADNRLLLVTTARGASLPALAHAMRELGALYALNLDGGNSAALWYRGRTIVAPRRRLTNLLCVYLEGPAGPARALRPPRGLDWRAGYRPRPTLTLSAEGLQVTATLPREWWGERALLLAADGPLPEGALVAVELDGSLVALAGLLPAEIALDCSELRGPRHTLSIVLRDGKGGELARSSHVFSPAG